MKIQAEVSLYPLRTKELSSPIDAFYRSMSGTGITLDPGRMSTLVSGDSARVFEAIQRAFSEAAEEYQVVLVVKLSNACPEREKAADGE